VATTRLKKSKEVPDELPPRFQGKINVNFQRRCLLAVLVARHDDRYLPGKPENAALLLGGAIYSVLTGEDLVIPGYGLDRDRERTLWSHLYRAALDVVRTDLDSVFLQALLDLFVPRRHDCPPDRPTVESDFENVWGAGLLSWNIHARPHEEDSELTLSAWRAGKEALRSLPPKVIAGAWFVGSRLEEAIKRRPSQ